MLGICDVPHTCHTLYAHIICEIRENVKWSLWSQCREVARNGRKQASWQWEAVLEFWRENDLGIGFWVVTEMGVQLCAISPGSRKLWGEHGLKLSADCLHSCLERGGKLHVCGHHTFIFGHAVCEVLLATYVEMGRGSWMCRNGASISSVRSRNCSWALRHM